MSKEDYVRAKRLGDRARARAIATGSYPYLPALDDFLEQRDILAEVPLGVQEIPLNMIVGTRTKGRTSSFAGNFMPILRENTEFAMKWADLYDAQQEEGLRDPIKCYEYMHRFYVLEGNKRVSVMKFVDAVSISADVIRLLPRKSEEKSIVIYYEFVQFYNVTGLYLISFSEPGCYEKLAELLGQNLTDHWPEEMIENLRYAFQQFEMVYLAKGGSRLDIGAGDAFLVYLNIFPLDSLIHDSSDQIGKNIMRIWNELLTSTSGDHLALIEHPELIQKNTGLIHDLLTTFPRYSPSNPLRVAFIYERNPEDSSWVYAHELGRNQLETAFGGVVDTIELENCQSDEFVEHAIQAAIADEDEVVFTTSPSMMQVTLRAAVEHPEIRFLNCSIHLQHNAVRTYYARMYEAKFLMGAIAASVADDHVIGYLADYPIYGSIANINAFAIGAAMVDPSCKISLKWSSWKNRSWQDEMHAEHLHIISGSDLIVPRIPDRRYGVYRYDDDGTVTNLATPLYNWGKYYELIIRSILDGSYDDRSVAKKDTATNYWYGLSAGVIDVILSDQLSYYTRKLVAALKSAIIAGSLSPFEGELHSRKGIVRATEIPDKVTGSESGKLSYEEIITMNWLADNVMGEIPSAEDLIDQARGTVLVSGVAAAKDGQES